MSVKQRLQDLYQEINECVTSFLPVTVICVSKGISLEKMQEAYQAGIRHFGENRLKEALTKKEQMPKDVVWHYIGPIQSNKAKLIAENFDVIHSLSSIKVAEIFSDVAQKTARTLSCFIQVNTTQNPKQQGFLPQELPSVIPKLQSLKGIHIQGFMTIAPHTPYLEKIKDSFCMLALLKDQWRLPFLSMGMSEDYRVALVLGATHIRLGSYFFS